MYQSFAKYLLPAGLALGLLVVLRAQNQDPQPPPQPPTTTTPGQPGSRPARPVSRPRTVVTPPPASPAAAQVAPAPDTPAAPLPQTPAPVSQIPAGEADAPADPATAETADADADAVEITDTADADVIAEDSPIPATPADAEAVAPAADTRLTTVESPAATTAQPPTPPSPVRPPAPGTQRLPGATSAAPVLPAATAGPVVAAAPDYDPEGPIIEFVEAAMDIGEILDRYESFTGRSTMRDANVQGTQLPLRSNGKMTRRQAAEYIKAFLLLNGYSIIPSDTEGVDKVIPTARGPQIEQGASVKSVYTAADPLPETEQIINYVMYLTNIGAEEAARSLQSVLGQSRQNVSKIIPIPAAGALIITDNLPAIRLAIALRDSIDVPSAAVVKEFFQLERADAEEVAQVLTDILAAQTRLRSQASGGTGARGITPNLAAEQLQQAGLPPGAVPGVAGQQQGGAPPPDESTVIVKAITRTNEVLISGRPSDLSYLRDLIKELDKEANVKNLQRFQLRFIRVEDFLQVAYDAIGRGQEVIGGGAAGGGAGGGGIAGGGGRGGAGRSTGAGFQGNPAFGGGQTFSSNAGGTGRAARTLGGAGGGGGGLASGRSSSPSASGQELIPSSTIVGKTLLISEPRSNSLLIAGPPEHLSRIAEVLEEMDIRPLQVAISTVIAEITLTDDMQYGIDILRKAEQIVVGGQDLTWAGTLTNLGDSTGIIDPRDLIDVSSFSGIGRGLNLYGAFGEFFNAYVRALEATGRAQVLSRPFVFTANNKEANIAIGRRIPVPSNTQTNTIDNTTTLNTNVEYEDVNLEILVTPLINSKNEVTLAITEINDGLGPERQVGELSVPEITQQFLTTEITVPNGGIAVIGGIIQETDHRANDGIPWIARVPILRGLLGNTVKGRRRSEILFFIQPRIVETSDELEAMHTDQIRRTAVGRKAQEFSKPAYDTNDIILPTNSGDYKLDEAHRLLPPDPAATEPPPPEPNLTNAQLKALRLDQPPIEEIPSTLPNEKPQRAFWEKTPSAAPAKTDPSKPASSSGPETPTKPKSGAAKLLPWNWGKKSSRSPDA